MDFVNMAHKGPIMQFTDDFFTHNILRAVYKPEISTVSSLGRLFQPFFSAVKRLLKIVQTDHRKISTYACNYTISQTKHFFFIFLVNQKPPGTPQPLSNSCMYVKSKRNRGDLRAPKKQRLSHV